MDSNTPPDRTPRASEETADEQLPSMQINPLSLMTALYPYQPIDDDRTYLLEPPGPGRSGSTDVATSYSDRPDQLRNESVPSANHTNPRTVAAWVQSTTTESSAASIERSPSLPSTLIDGASDRSRKNSNVSTLCEQLQQASMLSDVIASTLSHNPSYSGDVQRSFSFPMTDPYVNDGEQMKLVHEDNEDFATKFLAVTESEDSEIERREKPSPSLHESTPFEGRSPLAAEHRKRSSNVSFHASVSFDTSANSRTYRRQRGRHRNNSWTNTKNDRYSFQRTQSHRMPTPRILLTSQTDHPQLQANKSVPANTGHSLNDSARPSPSISDHVFQSISTTNSSSISQRLHLSSNSPGQPQFSPVPSSTSMLSSEQRASNISDASGQSGIESADVRTSVSEAPQTASVVEEDGKTFIAPQYRTRPSSGSTQSSRTASTESLPTSSSDGEMNTSQRMKRSPQTPADQKLDALTQLGRLLEKRPTIDPRINLIHRKQPPITRTVQPAPRPSHTPHLAPYVDDDLTLISKLPTPLFSSSAETSHQVHSLPANFPSPHSPNSPQTLASRQDPLAQNDHTVRSIQSDSSLTDSLINTKVSGRSPATPAFTSLISPAQMSRNTPNTILSQRKRISHHRRNLSGLAAVTRDRKNSFNRSVGTKSEEQQNNLQLAVSPPTAPLVRDTKAILNEHLIMINNLLMNYSFNASIQYPSQSSSIRDFLYHRLHELSLRNPMKQRCSRVETKAFIDSITSYQMNRSHHYKFLLDSIRNLLTSNSDPVRLSACCSEVEDDQLRNASHENSESSPSLVNSDSAGTSSDDFQAFKEHPLRSFRTLTSDYIQACDQTEKDLTQKLFDIADKQHILYCLKHVDSGHTNDLLSIFHRRLDAIFVWYNLYYELTISVKKLSGLLRCDDCGDWPKLHFRSLATDRERKAKRAQEEEFSSSEEGSDDDNDADGKMTEESEVENEIQETDSSPEKADGEDDADIIPKICWSDEPLDQFSDLKISDRSSPPMIDATPQKLNRTSCYRNFVYYMDKRSYQVKYDGLARTLIERVAPVLAKTRLALLQTPDRGKVHIEDILAGLSLSDFPPAHVKESDVKGTSTTDNVDDKLLDTDNPVNNENKSNLNIGEATIESWLYEVLKSCPTMKTIDTQMDDILKQNWLELHEQLGLPSLLPLYFFMINVLLDVMNECLSLYNKPYMNNDTMEIDALCRQQLVREAKLVLRDALATRLYSVRMMEQFFSNRKITDELAEYDEKVVDLYMHYKQYLSAVSVNRTYDSHDDRHQMRAHDHNTEYYYYVDEETSELIKEYYFARDLTLTLGNRDLIHALGIQFNDLVLGILVQLKEELYETTESYYQAFAADTSNASNTSDGIFSAEVMGESVKPSYFHSSISVPSDFVHNEGSLCDAAASFSEQKKCEIIFSTREFRRSFDTIKQRTIRICSLAKTLIHDFSLAAEFRCHNYADLWGQLRKCNYAQVKIYSDTSSSDDFDSFYLFVPPWLLTNKSQVEKLLNIICGQQLSKDELKKDSKESQKPSFMIFIPKKTSHLQNPTWTNDIVLIRASESIQLALNSTELASLHLVVARSNQWQDAVDLFSSHAGATNNIQLISKLARDEDIRWTFDRLPERIHEFSSQLTQLVRVLNAIWDQDSIKIFLTEIVKFDERQLRTIESKLLDLVLYVYNSGFELFRVLYELLPSTSRNDEKILKKFVGTMNEFFCEWCKCVTKKFKHTSNQQARAVKYKVLRPRWFRPGMIFLGFLATAPHLQLLNEDEYKKLMTEMPMALKALRGNTLNNPDSPTTKARSSSISSTAAIPMRPRNRSSVASSGHRRFGSGGGAHEFSSFVLLTPSERIALSVKRRENEQEQKLRDRKQIGQIYNATATTTPGSSLDPVVSLRTRNIDFPWRRGTRIGQGGAGVAFRAINSSNGSIVCMKEIQLSSIASRSLPSTYPEKLRRIAEEIDMIMSINHPNIVRYFGIEKYKRTIYICMEYCLSTVNEFLNDIRAFQKRANIRKSTSGLWTDSSDQDDDLASENIRLAPSLNVHELVRGFVKQLLQALLALHEHYIIHCDVKGDNIFIANENGNYIVKLGDFNLSHRLELESPSTVSSDSRSTQFGTLYFKPPELEYVYQSDIWALGCTIIEMLTGKLPWTNVARPNEERIYIQNQLLAKKGPPIPEELKEQKEAYDFIELCLTPDFNQRPMAKTLLDHPYPRVRTDS